MRKLVLDLHSAQGQVPDWIHLIPAGTFSGDDGRGPYKASDPQKLIEASLPAGGRPLPVDYEHGTVVPSRSGAAAGWITALQARDDGIWGKVEWTGAGRKAVESREYRFLSPMFLHTQNRDGGEITRILGTALTNTPNLGQLIALNSHDRAGVVGALLHRMQSDMEAIAAMTYLTSETDNDGLSAREAKLDAHLKEVLGLPPLTSKKKG